MHLSILSGLFKSAPTLIICLAGMILAGQKRGLRPTRLVWLGLVFLVITELASSLVSSWIVPSMYNERKMSTSQIAVILTAVGITMNFAKALGIGFLIAASLVDRAKEKPREQELPGDIVQSGERARILLALSLLLAGIGQVVVGALFAPQIPSLGIRLGVLGMIYGVSGLLFFLSALVFGRKA